ncbi:MAG: redoxin domain-containing protein, partial [Pseudomonadales bacterium]|nr:redoxin domain-containing protein [Pseudomonadales bacterium]
EVISISIDSHFTHQTWRDTAFEDGGLGAVSYTMVADLTQQIARDYDVQTSSGVAYRAAFLIDPRGVVRSQIVNDLPLSRNIDELLRLVDALQCHLSNSKSP